MSYSHNSLTLIGNVGGDPEIRTVQGGGRVAQFSVATSRQWTDGSGQKQEKVEWHRCVAWNPKGERGQQLADLVEKFVRKGTQVYIEGAVEYRQWQDKEGQTRYTTEVRCNKVGLLGSRRDGASDAGASAPARAATRPAAAAAAPAGRAATASASDDFSDFPGDGTDFDTSDLPF